MNVRKKVTMMERGIRIRCFNLSLKMLKIWWNAVRGVSIKYNSLETLFASSRKLLCPFGSTKKKTSTVNARSKLSLLNGKERTEARILVCSVYDYERSLPNKLGRKEYSRFHSQNHFTEAMYFFNPSSNCVLGFQSSISLAFSIFTLTPLKSAGLGGLCTTGISPKIFLKVSTI